MLLLKYAMFVYDRCYQIHKYLLNCFLILSRDIPALSFCIGLFSRYVNILWNELLSFVTRNDSSLYTDRR